MTLVQQPPKTTLFPRGYRETVDDPSEKVDYAGDLLSAGETLRVLLPVQRLELSDYVNMRGTCQSTVVTWQAIRHNWVTSNGKTIWQLTRTYWDKTSDAIGNDQPPVSLIRWILEESPRQ